MQDPQSGASNPRMTAGETQDIPLIQVQKPESPHLAECVYDGSNGPQPKGQDPRMPRIVFRDGEVGGKSYNETKVDVVLVPCPGADPTDTWTRAKLDIQIYGEDQGLKASQLTDEMGLDAFGKSVLNGFPLNPAVNAGAKSFVSWPRHLIKKEVNFARILSYDHGQVSGTQGLKSLADNLLQLVSSERDETLADRPLFFICHSIGGLVVKLALTMASRDLRYRSLLESCHGIAFFATPHRGSSYLSNEDFIFSIRSLLQLSVPLPPSLLSELQLEHATLLQVDKDFKRLASEIRIWSFYETLDSNISGQPASGPRYTHSKAPFIPFKAPVVSMRSALLSLRHERIYALRATHATCASFGMANLQTMRSFLAEFSAAICKADDTSRKTKNTAMRLEQKVMIEVHGFYEALGPPGAETEPEMRPFSAKRSLRSFFQEGPDGILSKRLTSVTQDEPEDSDFLGSRRRAASLLPLGTPARKTDDGKRRRGSFSLSLSSKDDPASETKKEGTVATRLNGRSAELPSSVPVQKPKTSSPTTLPGPTAPRNETFLTASWSRSETTLSLGRLPTTPGSAQLKDSTSPQKSSKEGSYLDLPVSTSSTFASGQPKDDSMLVPDKGRTSVPLPTRRPSISQPDITNRKFTWIHLPFNNPCWVTRVFDTLGVSGRSDFSEVFNIENWSSKHTRGRHSQNHGCFLKASCGYIPSRQKRLLNSQSRPRSDTASSQGCLYLYLPFLHFDSYKMLILRRNMIRRRMEQGRTMPVPADVANEASLELKVIWEFLGHDPPVNCRRTLDQYRYPSLHDTRARDDDQMLYKMTKEGVNLGSVLSERISYVIPAPGRRSCATSAPDEEEDEEEDDDSGDEPAGEGFGAEALPTSVHDVLDGNVLMVDQLWLWVIDTTTLVTFFPRRQGDPMEGPLHEQADLRDSIFNEVNADLTRRCENALDLAALTVLHAVSVLIDRSSHPDLEIFRIFEEAISILTEKMTSSLKMFRTSAARGKWHDDGAELKTSSIRARHKREDERAEQENRDNTSALLELRDIEDELSTLKHLFEDQQKQINTMLSLYSTGSNTNARPPTFSPHPASTWPPHSGSPPASFHGRTYSTSEAVSLTANGVGFLQEALYKLESYHSQAEDMIRRVEKTRQDFDKLLETIQRQAQIDEVRLSRQQADLASAQERSVMIFTVFTVIFLPLSFFTGVFGMNTLEWGGDGNLSLQTIGKIALPTSAALIGLALIVAWSTSMRKGLKYTRKSIKRCKSQARRWCRRQLYSVWQGKIGGVSATSRNGKPALQEAPLLNRKQRKELKKNMQTQGFWERHRIERELLYEIPPSNRRGPGPTKGHKK